MKRRTGKQLTKGGRYKAAKPKKGNTTGKELWSRRPNKGSIPNKRNKRRTHKMERQAARLALKAQT